MHVDECALFRFGLGVYGRMVWCVYVFCGRIDCPSCTAHLPAVFNRVRKVAYKGGHAVQGTQSNCRGFLLLGSCNRVSSFVL